MSVAVKEPQAALTSQVVVNDFNINVATANGSGSQTSNSMLIRSLYKMGIPVTGKNLFPSNIQGLPTWFNIRLSKEGFLARRERVEIMICMNGATVAEDMESVVEGGIVLYDDTLPIANHRKDVKYYAMPVKELVKAANLPYNLQKYIANMVYVGVAAYLLEVELEEIKAALAWNFGGKTKPIELNWGMVMTAYNWAKENLVNDQPYRVQRMTGFNEGTLLIDGNTAAASGRGLCRLHLCRLVSHHPLLQPGRGHDQLCQPAAPGPGDGQEYLCHRPGRGRVGGHWHGDRRQLGRRPRHDRDQRSRHQPHGGVCGLCLLHRDPGRDLGHPAHGAQHRLCPPAPARATSWAPTTWATATPAIRSSSRPPPRRPSTWLALRSICPSGCRHRSSS